MKQYILEIYENGYLDRIKRKWKVKEKQNCDARTSEKRRSLSAEKLASLFIIVFMGIISALFIMLMEFVTAYYFQKRRNQIDAPPQTNTISARINLMVQVDVRKFQNDPIYKKNVQDSFMASILQEKDRIQLQT